MIPLTMAQLISLFCLEDDPPIESKPLERPWSKLSKELRFFPISLSGSMFSSSRILVTSSMFFCVSSFNDEIGTVLALSLTVEVIDVCVVVEGRIVVDGSSVVGSTVVVGTSVDVSAVVVGIF